jgi:hypothetical protein
LTLRYTLKPGGTHKSKRLAQEVSKKELPSAKPEPGETEFGLNWSKISARITNPTVRQQFLKDRNTALEANTTHHAPHSAALASDKKVDVYHPKAGEASRGRATHAVVRPEDPEQVKKKAAIQAVVQKYSKDLNLPPAK